MKTRSALSIVSILVIGALFIIGATFNGNSVTTTKAAAAQITFQGGATDEMLAFALNFGEASNLAVFGGRSVSNRGNSVFRGDVGSAGKMVGIDGTSLRSYNYGQAKQDMRRALSIIRQLPCADLPDTELGGKTFTPGVYCLSSAELAGTMTVNGGDDPNARFIFRVAGTFKTDADSSIELADGATATNVYVVADDSITVGDSSTMNANLISAKTVTVNSGSTVGGKTIGVDGDVVTNSVTAGAGTGSVEICKAVSPGDPIQFGTIFFFDVPGFADPIQVPAGSCSAPLDVAIGNQIITERVRSNTAVVNIAVNPSNRMVSRNLGLRQVTVAVPEGGVSDQTVVTFTNQTTRTGTLEICKQGLDSDVTGFFNFTVQGAPGQTFAVPVGFCSSPITTTILQVPDTSFTANVTELARANFRLENVTTFPSFRLTGPFVPNQGFDANGNPINNPNGGYANVSLVSGGGANQATIVNFFNRSLPGRVKVCKITADTTNIPINTLFFFDVTGLAPTSDTQTMPGQVVTRRVAVPAGPDSQGGFCQFVDGTFVVGQPVVVHEVDSQALPFGQTFADTRVSRITASTTMIGMNLVERAVAFLARNNTTETAFTNFVFHPAVLKICKNAGTGITPGTPFTFTLSAVNTLTTFPISSAPITVAAGSCVFANGPFPGFDAYGNIGTFNANTQVNVTETAVVGSSVTAITSPTSPITFNLGNRLGTILLNQPLIPSALLNEIAFTNTVVAPPPVTFRARLDFDGDGKSDPVLFRPSAGEWWYASSSVGGTPRATRFGMSGDKLVAADYDGDGVTDFAVYRNGVWWVKGSKGSDITVPFGTATDIPQVGDFDGDGKADFVVYRPSEGAWYMLMSQDGFAAFPFGISTDRPVAADYDGDGKTDPAVFRGGTWYILGTTSGFYAFNWGISTDLTVPADYDGDHKADAAVYRNGEWWILQSTTGNYITRNLGEAGDIPTPADYDGDGKTDPSVYHPSTFMWYMLYSSSSYASMQFGAQGDSTVNY